MGSGISPVCSSQKSVNRNVYSRAAGSMIPTVSLCLTPMVMMRSASLTNFRLRSLDLCFERSIDRLRATSIARDEAGRPSTAVDPAEEMSTSSRSSSGNNFLAIPSASGLRHVFPEQTNNNFFKMRTFPSDRSDSTSEIVWCQAVSGESFSRALFARAATRHDSALK